MGFKSSVAIAQTTRFKRKLSSYNRNSTFTPPATPFNNTSFLIQLQQRREQGSTLRTLRFDQYGSMENMIACCSFATTSPAQNHPQHPIPGMSTSQSSNLSISISQNTDSPHGQSNSDADGSQICDSAHHEPPQQFNSCSDDAASSGIRPKLEADSEIREGEDGVLRHRHRQHFMDDNFDTHADLGSGTSATKK